MSITIEQEPSMSKNKVHTVVLGIDDNYGSEYAFDCEWLNWPYDWSLDWSLIDFSGIFLWCYKYLGTFKS